MTLRSDGGAQPKYSALRSRQMTGNAPASLNLPLCAGHGRQVGEVRGAIKKHVPYREAPPHGRGA